MIDEIEDHKSRGLKGARNFLFDSANLRTFRGSFAKKGAFRCEFNNFFDNALSITPQKSPKIQVRVLGRTSSFFKNNA